MAATSVEKSGLEPSTSTNVGRAIGSTGVAAVSLGIVSTVSAGVAAGVSVTVSVLSEQATKKSALAAIVVRSRVFIGWYLMSVKNCPARSVGGRIIVNAKTAPMFPEDDYA